MASPGFHRSNGQPAAEPTDAANFGSVYNTIGSSRVITMGLHITF